MNADEAKGHWRAGMPVKVVASPIRDSAIQRRLRVVCISAPRSPGFSSKRQLQRRRSCHRESLPSGSRTRWRDHRDRSPQMDHLGDWPLRDNRPKFFPHHEVGILVSVRLPALDHRHISHVRGWLRKRSLGRGSERDIAGFAYRFGFPGQVSCQTSVKAMDYDRLSFANQGRRILRTWRAASLGRERR